MLFLVYDAAGVLRCVSDNWPVARSVLDLFIQDNDGCPQLVISNCHYHISRGDSGVLP